MLKQQLVEAVIQRVYDLINEGRNADKAKRRTLAVISQFITNAKEQNRKLTFVDATGHPTTQIDIEAIENQLRQTCFHANIPDSVIRLEPIIMNIALQLGFEQQNQDRTKLNRLFRIVEYIKTCVDKQLPLPVRLNELTLEDTTYEYLNKVFGKVLDKQDAEEAKRIQNAGYSDNINPDYEILSDINYDTANAYGNYSCSTSKLCYTQDESTWRAYTNGGSNTVYLLLRKDWKQVPEKHGDDTPYDDYGLSMIFVFVDEDGNIAYSNTRWNHETNKQGPSNVDQSFTKESLSKLLNVNFDSVFKPLHSFSDVLVTAKQQLQNGADPSDVFDRVCRFYDGFARVRLGDKWNFINTDGNLLSDDLWFDSTGDFKNGFARVRLGDKWNFINTDGNLLSDDLWFDNAGDFHNGFARVILEDKFNYIDTDGNILREDVWFDEVEVFYKGFARVRLGDKWNLINTDGKIISEDLWFNIVWYFKNGFACVKLGGKYNLINTDGNILREDLWFDDAREFKNGFAMVKLNGKWYYIDTQGNLYDENKNPINNVTENRRRVVRLTERQIRSVIKSVITQYLRS